MKRKTTLALLALIAIGATVGAVVMASKSSADLAPAAPVPAAQVPSPIPPEGVVVNPVANIVLKPADAGQAALASVSAEDAIASTPAIKATAKPTDARAVMALATIGATMPTGSATGEKANPVENRLVWVVTLTYPEPVDTTAGGPALEDSQPLPASALKSHFNALIDASTGELIWGFFTT